MNCIRKKLQSNSGASVMIALGLFIICIMISSVVIAAAASGSSRNKDRMKQQREYLSISSAAQAIMDELDKLERYVGREITSKHVCDEFPSEKIEYLNAGGTKEEFEGYIPQMTYNIPGVGEVKAVMISDSVHTTDPEVTKERYYAPAPDPLGGAEENSIKGTELEGTLAQVVGAAVDKIYGSKTPESVSDVEVEFEINLPGEEEKLPNVNGKLIMDKNYNIKIVLTMTETAHVITITARANKQESERTITDATDSEYFSCWHSIRYKYLDDGKYILGESIYDGNSGGMEIIGTKTIETTTITWEEPKLIKGLMEEEAADDT